MLRRVSSGVLASAMLAGSMSALRQPLAALHNNSSSNSNCVRVGSAPWRSYCAAVQRAQSSTSGYSLSASYKHYSCTTTSAHARGYAARIAGTRAASGALSPSQHLASSAWPALRVSMRSLVAAPSRVCRIRVNGRDDYIRPQNTPMQWSGDGSSSGGGSQMDSLTPHVRAHLTRVYGLLMAGCCVAGIGSMLMIATPLVKIVPFWLPMLGGFVPLLWLSFAPPANPALKTSLFFAFTLLEGMALAPLVLMTSMKGVLVTSIVLTAAIFGGFSAAAYLSPRASLVSWQGPLFGALIGLVAVSLLNAFYPTAIAHSLILYGGLALFSVLVAVDTQAMIERARCGAGDAVQDALQMFLNVVNIFVRIAQIMGDSR